jgi:hypothetical protein
MFAPVADRGAPVDVQQVLATGAAAQIEVLREGVPVTLDLQP